MRRGDVNSCGRQRGEAVRGGQADFLTSPGPMGPRTSQDQHPCPRNVSLRYNPQPCPGWTLGGRHEPDTGTNSLSLGVPAGVCSEDTRVGCRLEWPRAAAGRAMKGHGGNRRTGRGAAGLCSGLSAGFPAAPGHPWPLYRPALRPQALTQGSLPTGPSLSMLLLSGGATVRPLGPLVFLSCGL